MTLTFPMRGGTAWLPPQVATPARDAALLASRVLIVAVFVIEGVDKVTHIEATRRYMEAFGIPGVLLAGAVLLELGGGIAVALGALTRLAALALAVFCLFVAVQFHWTPEDAGQMLHFWKDLAIAGGFLALAASGAGTWSVDHWWSHRS